MTIRMTRVYTRTGDKGTTGLVGGSRTPKDSARLDAYGTIDELNSVLGLGRGLNAEGEPSVARDRLNEILRCVQNELFDLGSELATPREAQHEKMSRVGAAEVTGVEDLIDECQADLEPLRSFILPGGGKVSGCLHLARSVCRRAEREILRLSREETISDHVLAYVNRLSDLLFVLARRAGKDAGEAEYPWKHRTQKRAAPKSGKGK